MFQLEIAAVIAVEIGLDVELIYSEQLITAEHHEVKTCAGGRGAELAALGRRRRDRNQIRRECGAVAYAVKVKITAHS